MADMIVSRLPVLTWNRLDMNEGVIKDTDKKLLKAAKVRTDFETLPDGVTSRRITQREAASILAKTPAQPAEKFVAGKVPIYHAQKFATGVGKEFDDYASKASGGAELLEVEEGKKVETPVSWHIDFYNENRAVSQQIIHVKKGASLNLEMDYSSDRKAGGFAGISTKVILDEGASLKLCKVQLLGSGFLHVDDLGISFGQDSKLDLSQVEVGGNDVYAGVQAELIGDRSQFTSRIAYLSRGDGHVDVTYNAVQRGKKTKADMSFDGVLKDRASKIWRGTIDFRNGSSGSAGHENENILLLDDDIENKSMPLILCEEEDVEGQHGSTIGRLADDILFYMGTRGIDERTAEEIMVYARFDTVTREIPDKSLKDRVYTYLQEIFG